MDKDEHTYALSCHLSLSYVTLYSAFRKIKLKLLFPKVLRNPRE